MGTTYNDGFQFLFLQYPCFLCLYNQWLQRVPPIPKLSKFLLYKQDHAVHLKKKMGFNVCASKGFVIGSGIFKLCSLIVSFKLLITFSSGNNRTHFRHLIILTEIQSFNLFTICLYIVLILNVFLFQVSFSFYEPKYCKYAQRRLTNVNIQQAYYFLVRLPK